MKSDMDARPVFVQKENTIKGHFLICYLSVLLERIFQFNILENKYGASEILGFIKGFIVAKGEGKYIYTTIDSSFIIQLSETTGLPLRNYYLTETQLRSIFNYKP